MAQFRQIGMGYCMCFKAHETGRLHFLYLVPGEIVSLTNSTGNDERDGAKVILLENWVGIEVEINEAIVKGEDYWFGWRGSLPLEDVI